MSQIRITLPGYEVLTDTDPRHYSLDSDDFQYMMRLQDTGSGTYSIPASAGIHTVTVAHNLGYVPYFKCYVAFDDHAGHVTKMQDATSWTTDYGVGIMRFLPKADTTNLYLRWNNTTGAGSWTSDYYYFIGRDPAV